MDCGTVALGRSLRRDPVRHHRACSRAVPAAPWTRSSHRPLDARFTRQYRCAQARWLHRYPRGQRGRFAVGRAGTGQVRHRRPVHRQHQGSPIELFRGRVRCACLHGRSGVRPPVQTRCESRRRSRGRMHRGRDLSRHGGAAVFHPRRKPALSPLGRRSNRHDRNARGPAGPRGGAALCPAGDGDRLRLLA